MNICLDARLVPGEAGGVQQVVVGLASGLRDLAGDEQYQFLVRGRPCPWLEPELGGALSLLEPRPGFRGGLRRRAGNVALARRAMAGVRRSLPRPETLPVSDGTVESSGAEMIHFTTQTAFETSLPSIYQPHDLQYRVHPENFTSEDRRRRDFMYREFSERAALVVAMTAKGRSDLIEHFDLPAEKIAIVPWAPLIPSEIRAGEEGREAFALYPAQTWPHKNHAGLVDALCVLRDDFNLTIPVVCTGFLSSHYREIRKRIDRSGLGNQIQFRGFVPSSELRDLYLRARFLVFPSRFEGWGLPVSDALSVGLPVAASDLPELREHANGAVEWFDPENPAAMAAAMARLWTDRARRDELRRIGEERVSHLSWLGTAEIFRAHYRRITGVAMTPRDHDLVASSLS